jgi:hypothetical protein
MKYFKLAWCLISVAILVYALTFREGPNARERDIIVIYCMLAMSFPLGLVGSGVATALLLLADKLDFPNSVHPLRDTLLTWLLFFGFGYLQWFVLIPWVVKRVKAARQ